MLFTCNPSALPTNFANCLTCFLNLFFVQRPPFYGLKMGLLPSGKRALKVSLQAFFLSFILIFVLPQQFRIRGSIGSQIIAQIGIFIMSTAVAFCWEISHHFVQVCSSQANFKGKKMLYDVLVVLPGMRRLTSFPETL